MFSVSLRNSVSMGPRMHCTPKSSLWLANLKRKFYESFNRCLNFYYVHFLSALWSYFWKSNNNIIFSHIHLCICLQTNTLAYLYKCLRVNVYVYYASYNHCTWIHRIYLIISTDKASKAHYFYVHRFKYFFLRNTVMSSIT